MKKEVMKKWVKALRSGDYKQGTGKLRNGDSYCCLGVLCEVLEVPKKQYGTGTYREYSYGTNGDLRTGELPNVVMELAEIKCSEGTIEFPNGRMLSLSVLNDDRKRSFKQIAAFIERNWEKL